jgi:uncharacterized protein YndB with AHSA1/START domain
VSADLLIVEQHIGAKPQEVFADLTIADRLLRWWGDREEWWLTKADVELRAGGRYWLSWENTKGETNDMGGRFKTIRPNQGFVLSFVGSHAKDHTDELAIELKPEAGGTKVVLCHSGLAGRPERYADYQQGWKLILGWLARQYDTPVGKK